MMQLDKLTVNVRPMSSDEAIELGFGMARAWYWDLLQLWWVQARYFVLILVALFLWFFYQNQLNTTTLFWVGVVFYFCKPYFEIKMLLYLSRKLFDGDYKPEDVKTIKISPLQIIKTTLKARFSHKSIILMAVSLLENQSGKALSERQRILSRGSGNAMLRHSTVFWLLQVLLFFGAVVLVLKLLSASYVGQPAETWFQSLEGMPVWLMGLLMLIYLLCVSMLSPFFVASGFALYVCRRSLLEGWDIELIFRTIAKRYQDSQHIKRQKLL